MTHSCWTLSHAASPLCSGVWCWPPLCGSTPTSLFASLCPAATALSALQPLTASLCVASSTASSGSPVNCLSRVPFPLPDTVRFHVQESFVWFRAKTDSSALAAYPHSTTYICIPDGIYGLTLAWVTSENSTMLLESDSSWLTLAGPYPMLPRLSAPVSGVDRPSVDPRQPLCSPLSVQPPTALCWVASSTASSGSPVNCLSRVPFPLPDTARFHVQESFVWFRAKTDSSALAAYPHSATNNLSKYRTSKNF